MSELKFKVIKSKKRVAYEMVYRDFWQWCYANAIGSPINYKLFIMENMTKEK